MQVCYLNLDPLEVVAILLEFSSQCLEHWTIGAVLQVFPRATPRLHSRYLFHHYHIELLCSDNFK